MLLQQEALLPSRLARDRNFILFTRIYSGTTLVTSARCTAETKKTEMKLLRSRIWNRKSSTSFFHWLYNQEIPEAGDDFIHIASASHLVAAAATASSDPILVIRLFLLLKTCVLADYLKAPDFKRCATNAFVNPNGSRAPYYGMVSYAFDELDKSDTMLRFMVDLQCTVWKPADDVSAAELALRARLPNSFLVRDMLRYHELKGSKNDVDKDNFKLCRYRDPYRSNASCGECGEKHH